MSFWFPPWFTRRPAAPPGGRDAVPTAGMAPPRPTVRPSHVPRQLSLATATREYARKIEAGTFDRLRDRDLAPLAEGMGPALWSWQRARRLTRQSPWRAGSNASERHERARALREMRLDLPTWEKALAAVDLLADRAGHYDMPPPEPLAVPEEIKALIEERRRAVVERATRRRGAGKGVGRPPPDGTPDDDPFLPDHPATTAAGGLETSEQHDDERDQAAPTPPRGPRR